MNEQFQQAKEIFLAVCDLRPEQRSAMLEQQCGDDDTLRSEVDSLLEYYDVTSAATPGAYPQGGQEPTVQPSPVSPGGERERIGPYRIVHELGAGGMGVVFLAIRDGDQLRRRVALKVLKRGMDTADILRRFDVEQRALAALNHPNIARLFDAGETDDGLPYFVMEYVEGQAIDKYCDQHRLRIDERLELFKDVCAAVHHAHQNLIVHRDLKPANIIVTEDGVVKLLDFGIAKIIHSELSLIAGDPTAPEFRVMTPQYASPEQVRGAPVTTASDIYSLGVLLYEIVSGHRPYRLRSRVRADIERVICEEDPERPSTAISRVDEVIMPEPTDARGGTTITPESVSRTREGRPQRLRRRLEGDIDNIVLMAMRKETQRRYKSAEQLAEDIDRHLRGMPVLARPDTVGYRFTKFVTRHRTGTAAAIVVTVSLLAGMAGTTSGWQAARTHESIAVTQRDEAQAERDRADQLTEQVLDLAHTFMFDFHDAIQEMDGALPVREMLVESALTQLESTQELVGENRGLRHKVALAWQRLGDIRGGRYNPSQGNLHAALDLYRRAFEQLESLATATPDDPEVQAALASSHLRMGDAQLQMGDVAEGSDHYQAMLAIRERLAADPDADWKTRRQVNVALLSAGKGFRKIGDHAATREYYQRSVDGRKQLAAEFPDKPIVQRDVAVGMVFLGAHLGRMGEHEAALEQFEQSREIRERQFRTAPNARSKRDYALAELFVADTLLELGRVDAALPGLTESLRLIDQLIEDNPEDQRSRRDRAEILESLGRQHEKSGQPDEAMRRYRQFQAAAFALIEEDQANTDYRGLLGESCERIGDIAGVSGDNASAIRQYGQAMEIFESLALEDPANVQWRVDRAPRMMRRLGGTLLAGGRRDEARRRLEAARIEYEALAAKTPVPAEVAEGLEATNAALAELEDD